MRSDDYLAIAWASDWDNVLHDFVGPYQGAVRLALFYRPLITLSVAIDTALGGGGPFIPLLMNVVVHVANAMLLLGLLRRFSGMWAAFAATLFWALHPGHAEAVSWMIGRVDTHATLFYLATIVLLLRWQEGRTCCIWPAVVTFVLGGMTKEVCLTAPAAVWLITAARAPSGQRTRSATRATAPFLWALTAVLAVRWLCLGEVIGGYAAHQIAPLAALCAWQPLMPAAPLSGLPALLGPLLLLVVLATRKRRLLPALLVLFVVTALPAAGAHGAEGTARYYYLPSAALAGALALGGPALPAALLLLFVPQALTRRAELRALSSLVSAVRLDVEQRLGQVDRSADPLLVEAPSAENSLVLFHVGTDRLGRPPFSAANRTVLPKRPIFPSVESQTAPPRIGPHTLTYIGPAPLDGAAFDRISKGESAVLRLEGPPVTTWRILVATSLGWQRVTVPVEGNELPLADLLLRTEAGVPENLMLNLWPSLEVSANPQPWVFVDGARAPVALPLTRDLGLGLRAKEPRAWLLPLLLFFSWIASFGGHRRGHGISVGGADTH